ncbi:uncharacterized protein LOC123528008 [Mercenaria mercenaria]|uniref:uncharacterized protein LOC123528008 n=1 Tax=Mercenaria mercenaria TaxID=6596 RepID=UPI00234F8D3D|nr:uncharacterized protein LOC123528008 [Mercenaria mercenaria]
MAFFELLVREHIFDEVHISFLFVGHTHEDVDAGFSRIWEFLRRKDAETLEDLTNLLPNSELLNDMLDIKAWLEPHLNIISKHTVQHHFKFSKVSGETVVEYKLHQAEEWVKQDVTYLNSVPKGKPNILKQDYSKVDFLRLQNLINSIHFMFSDESKKRWWDKFLKEKYSIKDTGKRIWIDALPKQQIYVEEIDFSNVIPEPVKKMIEKETQPVKIVSKARRQTVHKKNMKKTTQKQQKKTLHQQKKKTGKKKTTVVIHNTKSILIPMDREVKRQIWLRIFMDLLEFLLATAVMLILTLEILVKFLHIFAVCDILLLLNDIWMAVLVSHLGVLSKTVIDNTSFFGTSLHNVFQCVES